MMAIDRGQTWDLSPNDQAAIKWALGRIAQLEQLRQAQLEVPPAIDREELGKLVYQAIQIHKRGDTLAWEELYARWREIYSDAAEAVVKKYEEARHGS
jgi:hypothetical protein